MLFLTVDGKLGTSGYQEGGPAPWTTSGPEDAEGRETCDELFASVPIRKERVTGKLPFTRS